VKQSIYRFRQAEPSLFLDKYARYGKGDGGTLLNLTRNFRSARSVLDFTNAVFEKLMTGGDSEIVHDEAARLRPGSDDAPAGDPVEVHVVTGSGEDELTSGEREGLLIAKRIKEMMVDDPDLHYRDFAILTRAKRGVLLTDRRSVAVIQDELTVTEPVDVVWYAWTKADVTLNKSGRSAYLTQNGKTLLCKLGGVGSPARFEAEVFGESGMTRLSVRVSVKERLRLAVSCKLLEVGESRSQKPYDLLPISRWGV
jgi:hypothetical protein